MARSLAVVAGGGIALSFICLAAAAALGGDGLHDLPFGSFFSSCRAVDSDGSNSREFAWEDPGDDVAINVPARVLYKRGSGDVLVASGPAEMLDHLRVRGGRIDFDCGGMFRRGRLDLTLPGRAFSDFSVNGSGTLTLEDINQPRLTITIRGSGKASATGTAEEVDLSIAGSGDADFGKLAAKRVDINIAGSGNADVAPEEAASVNIAGSGKIRLLKQPRSLETHIAGSGRIINAPSTPSAPAAK